MFNYLILDYEKPNELGFLLKSIKELTKVPYKVIYLNNGSQSSDYAYDFYKNGFIDEIILKKNGNGGGYGQEQLFRYCDSKYAAFVQVDQLLAREIDEEAIQKFIGVLEAGYQCVDLANKQCGENIYSERAHFIDVDFYNKIEGKPHGGPGPFHHLPWNEGYIQSKFKENNWHVFHDHYFADAGKYAIRQNPDGSRWTHRTDTKQLKLLSGPISQVYSYPNFTEIEWEQVLDTQLWAEWKIPENDVNSSFFCWGDVER